jgi:hypothetical protein
MFEVCQQRENAFEGDPFGVNEAVNVVSRIVGDTFEIELRSELQLNKEKDCQRVRWRHEDFEASIPDTKRGLFPLGRVLSHIA